MWNAAPRSALPLAAGDAEAIGRHETELPGEAGELGSAELLGAVDAVGADDALGAAGELDAGDALDANEGGALGMDETLGTAETLGAAETDGTAEAQAIGLADGATEAEGMIVGDGLGRSPTGSGPTKTNAARMPTATRTPTSRPASMVIPVFIAAEGTSTDGRGRRVRCRC
jgi:hypothetical protein